MFAARLANMRREDTLKQNQTDRPIGLSGEAVSQPEAAAQLNVSERSVKRAAAVLREATPEVIAAVNHATAIKVRALSVS